MRERRQDVVPGLTDLVVEVVEHEFLAGGQHLGGGKGGNGHGVSVIPELIAHALSVWESDIPGRASGYQGRRVAHRSSPKQLARTLADLRRRYTFGQRRTRREGYRGLPRATAGRPGHRQRFDAVDELRQQPRGLVRRHDIGDLAAQFVEDDADLTTSQVGAQAEMRTAAAEAEMRIGVRATSNIQGSRTSTRRDWPSCTTASPCRRPSSWCR